MDCPRTARNTGIYQSVTKVQSKLNRFLNYGLSGYDAV